MSQFRTFQMHAPQRNPAPAARIGSSTSTRPVGSVPMAWARMDKNAAPIANHAPHTNAGKSMPPSNACLHNAGER